MSNPVLVQLQLHGRGPPGDDAVLPVVAMGDCVKAVVTNFPLRNAGAANVRIEAEDDG